MNPASLAECEAALAALRASFNAGKTKSYASRMSNLRAVKRFLKENEDSIVEALKKDLHRDKFDAVGLELIPLYSEVDFILKHLKGWMEVKYPPLPSLMQPATSECISEPYGVALIISAFNYPVDLAVRRIHCII